MTDQPQLIPLPTRPRLSPEAMLERSQRFLEMVKSRRTVRDFSPEAIPQAVLENAIKAAATAPNGANRQPWHFVVVQDPALKKQIREAAEEEERAFYNERAPQDWLDALAPLGTDEHKPFLETAPALIVIFAENHGLSEDQQRVKNYYVSESVGIATGLLITALHDAGLATLTHTPSPMKFLNSILERPSNERPFLILVVGHPSADARVPDIQKKAFDSIATFR